ncbi:ATP-binding protein [Chitinophagaceae bacterium LB-8]|uniref:histidine kinase n=1 Tax=Paraflavisolibacter caeni TaxID=2982496 RepID=A0A9X3B9U4_9BACT|nr:ATP-binding protein [Paraflavisolibacter caeni]MCU7551766.1 ATP-binding protein [Paraflavisolibacter caeni]
MATNRLIYFIVAAFIAGNLILIFIKYNSDKNIDKLIDDNEKLLDEFSVNNQLKTMERDVVLVESKVRGTVATNDTAYMEGVELQMAKVKSDLDDLQKIKDEDSAEEYIDQLDILVREKLRFNDQVLDVYTKEGKKAAEAILITQRGKRFTDSILLLTQKISNVRQNTLSRLSQVIDDRVKQMQRLDTFLIVFVLISAAVLFWYILSTIRIQSHLIQQVSDSEKKVKEAAKVKENFLANMSHEIRTPLNAILGFTNLLQRKDLDRESASYIQTIQRSGENLLAIINDILDLSKIEAGMLRIERAPFSLRGLVHSIDAMFRTKADEKGIQFFTHVDESLPDRLEGDATRLTQILVNLIGNAIKFTAKGKVAISIRNKGIEADIVTVEIEVNDTGIGIQREKLEYIFERFQQADDAVTREYGGTGLGLSIVKELVALQQGSIHAESEPGKGATFYLIIPYRISGEQFPSDNTVNTQIDTEPAVLQNINVLIVEDNEVNQTLLQHLFRNWQVKFEIANNGIEAIEKLRANVYDLILMDIQMPQMDGYTATRQIRNHLKLNTPIVAMTAHAMAGEREKCLSYGMNEYISKPIQEEQLRKLITQFYSLETIIAPETEMVDAPIHHTYQYINLAYMKAVSAGNKEYEEDVTAQFIKAVPQELAALEKAVELNDTGSLRRIAHNLKTTISVMGLNETLQAYLDGIENGEGNEQLLKENVENVKRICSNALPEAKHYLASIRS